MKKGFKNIFLNISLFIFMILIFPKNAFALNFKVERNVDTVKPGGEVTVTIKVTDTKSISSDSLNTYNVQLAYDSNKLEYKSGASDISNIAAGNPITLSKGNGTIDSDTTLATLVFGVKAGAAAGDTNLTLTNANLVTISGNNVTATNTSSMIKIAALGSDASLSNLKIPNATLSPKFDKNTYEYTTELTDLTEITVNATATDTNAKIMISENYKSLVKGENVIKITVTAENGTTTKTYQIKANLTVTPTEEEKLKANALLKAIEVKNYELEFASEIKKYTLSVPYKTKKLTINAEAVNPNAKVEIDKADNLKVGKNEIKIVVTSEDTENTETYILNVTREKEEKKIVQTCPDTTSTREWVIFSISMLVTFTLGIVLGFFMCKKDILKKIFKKKEKVEVAEEINTLSDTIEIDTNKVNDEMLEENEKKEENSTEEKEIKEEKKQEKKVSKVKEETEKTGVNKNE
jgi:hypothetical protein